MTKSTDIEITASAERFDSGEKMAVDKVELGQWYWVKEKISDDPESADVAPEWFGCVVNVGSNYVELHEPHGDHDSYRTRRVHVDQFDRWLRYEPDHLRVIDEKTAHYRNRVNELLGEITEVTRRLGVVPQNMSSEQQGGVSNALVAVTQQADVGAYKLALIEAKEKTIPELHKEVEGTNRMLVRWLIAPAMALRAVSGGMKATERAIGDRIHTLELYAGLTEEAVQVRDGMSADRNEKLRVMQRRFYMDEECLAAYQAGGIEIKTIGAFDEWLSQSESMHRILPFERCVVAFRVRRSEKERDRSNIWDVFVNISLRDADKLTFLYVRNGEQLWRINCDFDFGEKIFPDATEFDPGQPMMVKMFGSRVDEIIPYSQWEFKRDEYNEELRKRTEWRAANPDKSEFMHFGSMRSDWKEYSPFDPSNVYYDEAAEFVSDAIKKYNRVAVIIQGLFDRSLVLHPHGPVKVWEPESFVANVELMYDATSLTHGDKPDFEAYRQFLNSQIDENSILTGQEEFWLRAEAEKENNRQAKVRRDRSFYYTRYAPHGNPGPGLVGSMAEWKGRSKKAVFKWARDRQTWSWSSNRNGRDIPCSITVPVDKLLNVSAYRPGDFKRFFEDPRTRREYLEWAHLMLAAEDYHAGKVGDRKTATNSW